MNKKQAEKVQDKRGKGDSEIAIIDDDKKSVLCPNCKQIMQPSLIAAHTITCYRNSSKCKICGEIVQKDKKKEHIAKYKDFKVSFRDIEYLLEITRVHLVG